MVGKGQAVRIMTGAMLPAGADTVVDAGNHSHRGRCSIHPGRPAKLARIPASPARIWRAEAWRWPQAKRIGPAELGVIASLGIAEVEVKRRLRVAFFSTGDELASIGKPLAPGEVYDSNRYTLHGLLTRLGADIIDMGVVPDRPEALEAALSEAAEVADAIITTGGVSVGEADFVKEILAKLGEVKFWKLNIKPGRPDGFRQDRQSLAVRPARQPGGGDGQLHPVRTRRACCVSPACDPLPARALLTATAGKCRSRSKPVAASICAARLIATVDGQWQVRTTSSQGSGILRSMTEANCFIVLPEDCAGIQPGDRVEVQLFNGLF
jgi:molybdopterin molybdotransferase